MPSYKKQDSKVVRALTYQQVQCLDAYHERWSRLHLDSCTVSRSNVKHTLTAIYSLLGKDAPEVVFCRSPKDFVQRYFSDFVDLEWRRCRPMSSAEFDRKLKKGIGTGQASRVRQLVSNDLLKQLNRQVKRSLFKQHEGNQRIALSDIVAHLIPSPLGPLHPGGYIAPVSYDKTMEQLGRNCLSADLWIYRAAWLDFCTTELGCQVDLSHLAVFKQFVKVLSYRVLFLFSHVCFVCDYPDQLLLDVQMQMHGDGVPAVKYADSLNLYVHHGRPIPEKYGSVLSERWQPRWLLEERNVEIRRVLVQAIGYGRMCQELEAKTLDTWREYQLLRIDGILDTLQSLWTKESIHLLKMVCPSTNSIHILRVPPEITQAREAIRWVNHGVDPEDFVIET